MFVDSLKNLSSKQLQRAASIKARIEKLETQLTGLIGIPEPLTIGGTVRRHRRMSAAAKAKISAAAKKRWAKFRAGEKNVRADK